MQRGTTTAQNSCGVDSCPTKFLCNLSKKRRRRKKRTPPLVYVHCPCICVCQFATRNHYQGESWEVGVVGALRAFDPCGWGTLFWVLAHAVPCKQWLRRYKRHSSSSNESGSEHDNSLLQIDHNPKKWSKIGIISYLFCSPTFILLIPTTSDLHSNYKYKRA